MMSNTSVNSLHSFNHTNCLLLIITIRLYYKICIRKKMENTDDKIRV